MATLSSVCSWDSNYYATSLRDSTIISPVSVCHHGSYAERYSRFTLAQKSPEDVGTRRKEIFATSEVHKVAERHWFERHWVL
jgi:hypothetical protein